MRLIASSFLISAIYISNFNSIVSTIVLAATLCFKASRNLLILSAPLLFLILVFLVLFGSDLTIAVGFAAIISSGGIITNTSPEVLRNTLSWFRLPEKVILSFYIPFRLFYLLVLDIDTILPLNRVEGRWSSYLKSLKTLISVSVLRTLAISEAIYSTNPSFKFYDGLKPKTSDIYVLILSIVILVISLLLSTS